MTEVYYVIIVSTVGENSIADAYLIGTTDGEPQALSHAIDMFKTVKNLDAVELKTTILYNTEDPHEAEYFFDRFSEEIMKMAAKRS